MGKVTFTNSKIDTAIVGERQRYRSSVTSAGVCDTGALAGEVARNLKDNAAYVENVLKECAEVAKRRLTAGERVLLDGLCRLELYADGSAISEDAAWDPTRNRLYAKAIAYDELKNAPSGIVPENTMKPVVVQLLGAQDATTLEQNALVKGDVLLLQGKNIQVTEANEDEGYFLVKDDAEYRLNISQMTAGTADLTLPESVPAAEGYVLEVRGRAGQGTNRMLVKSAIGNFTVKAA